MVSILYTIGYQQRDLDEYIELLREAAIDVIVDVRETAWSHKRGFSKAAFATALGDAGIDYIHAKFAGNPKRLRSTSRTHEDCLSRYAKYVDENRSIIDSLEELVEELLKAHQRVCLTCFERHSDDCHRSILAERWRRSRRRRRVLHLATDGCARLMTVRRSAAALGASGTRAPRS